MKLFAVFLTVMLTVALTTPLVAQEARLIAMVRVKYDGYVGRVGAAIIVDHNAKGATLVTAAHTVTDEEGLGGKKTLDIEFLASPGKQYSADVKLLKEENGLDLAVLTVALDPDHPARKDFEATKHALLPPPLTAQAGDGLFAIGFPSERAWLGNQEPDRLIGITDNGKTRMLGYESSITVPGMSGGGLFGQYGALIGMVIEVSATQAFALDISTIRDIMTQAKLPFSLESKPDVVKEMASATLRGNGAASSGALARALAAESVDFSKLHLYWIANFDSGVIENTLQARVPGKDMIYAELLVQRTKRTSSCVIPQLEETRQAQILQLALEQTERNKDQSCEFHALVWLREILKDGVNPDLVVKPASGFEKAMLAIAMEARATEASLVLLDAGATGNPYIDLNGLWQYRNLFTHPFWYVNEKFIGRDQDRLWTALLKAGAVEADELQDVGIRSMPKRIPLKDSKTDPACERAKRNVKAIWCAEIRELSAGFSFPNRSSGGTNYGTLKHLLFADAARAFVLAQRAGELTPVVLEISRSDGKATAFYNSGNYGCRKRADGSAPMYCWRGFDASISGMKNPQPNVTVELKAENSKNVNAPILEMLKDGSGTLLDNFKIRDVSLSMSFRDAMLTLEKKGFVRKT